MKLLDYSHRAWKLLRRRPKGWASVLYNTAMAKARMAGPLMIPAHITIEPANVCNLKCPVCETGNGSLERSRGMLDNEKFVRFIDEVAPHTSVLMFYFMGEPFLNKHAYDMIRYARGKDIYVETCTNGDYIDPAGVVYSDVNQISIQIGGMTQETHEIYRVGGNLERVRKNICAVLEERRRHPGSNVQVEVGLVVMKHNEHEIGEFMRWTKEIGVDRANVIDPCVRTVGEGKKMLPADRKYWFYDEAAFNEGVLKPKLALNNECTWIWNSAVVNWDGSVAPCCRDANGHHVLGNVFERPLREIWNGKAAIEFRRRILLRQKEVDICRLCSGFGVPQLLHSRPTGFEVHRMTLDLNAIDIPNDIQVMERGARP